MTTPAPRTARERARAEITAEILASARRQMAAEGAAAISLRAVARDLGMVSSAVYRYFPSRDDLLTRLIIESYDALGDAVDAAESVVPRDDYTGRFVAAAHATRRWALDHPHEWALLYGTPVPGYAAPPETIGPGTRVSVTMARIMIEAVEAGAATEPPPVPRKVSRSLRRLREFFGAPTSFDGHLVAGLMARTQVFGHISLELDGQFDATIEDPDAFFDHVARLTAATVGVP